MMERSERSLIVLLENCSERSRIAYSEIADGVDPARTRHGAVTRIVLRDGFPNACFGTVRPEVPGPQ